MAGFLTLVLIVAVVVWLVDRERLPRRLDSIESAVDRLMRESAMNRAARRRSESAQSAAPAAAPLSAPSPPPSFTPRADTAVPAIARPRADQPAATPSTSNWTPPPIADFPGLRQIREFFAGGNLIVRVGVVVLFFGIAFLRSQRMRS